MYLRVYLAHAIFFAATVFILLLKETHSFRIEGHIQEVVNKLRT